MLFYSVLCLLMVAQIKAKIDIVDMGSLNSYGVFSYNSVSNEGSSTVYGNIGLSDGSDLSGFPPGKLSGSKYIGTAETVQGHHDLNDAIVDAGSRPITSPAFAAGQDLGGMTLPPGVYNAPTSMSVTIDDLVLDAQNDPDAVWIFQIGSSFVVANERVIRMINRAKSSSHTNVWWNVGSSATYQIDSVVIGVTLAYATITAQTGATTGALLSANGAVTMSTNTVTAFHASETLGLSTKDKLIIGLVVGFGGLLILLVACWFIFGGGIAAASAAYPAATAPAAAAPTATDPAVNYEPVSSV